MQFIRRSRSRGRAPGLVQRAVVGTAALAMIAGCSGSSDDASSDEGTAAAQSPAAAPSEDTGSSDANETLRIGALSPVTGAAASFGRPQEMGIELAAEQINEAGGIEAGGTTYTVELVKKDTETDPTATVSAVQDLLGDGIHYLIGSATSSGLGAYLPIIEERDDVITVITGAALAGATDTSGVYRPRVTLPQYTTATIAYMEQEGYGSVALLTDNTHTGMVEQTETLVDGLANAGIEVVAQESYQAGATDLRSQLTSLRDASPDAINLRGFPADAARAIRQARELGYEGPIVSTAGMTETEVQDAGAADYMASVVDIVVPQTSDLIQLGGDQGAAAEDFDAAYREAFGEAPGFLSLSGFNGMWILARAIENAGSVDDVAAVKDSLDALTVDAVPELVEPISPSGDEGLVFDNGQAYFAMVVRSWGSDGFVVDESLDPTS